MFPEIAAEIRHGSVAARFGDGGQRRSPAPEQFLYMLDADPVDFLLDGPPGERDESHVRIAAAASQMAGDVKGRDSAAGIEADEFQRLADAAVGLRQARGRKPPDEARGTARGGRPSSIHPRSAGLRHTRGRQPARGTIRAARPGGAWTERPSFALPRHGPVSPKSLPSGIR